MNLAYKAALTTLIGLALTPSIYAAERITLTNGFDVVCHHHALVDGRVRVYPKPANEDYIEVSPESVRTVETVPDPVPEPVAGIEFSSPSPVAATVPPPVDAKLTPADLHQLLAQAGSAHNVDEDLLASLVKMESGGNAHAHSKAGARGLMQLMPGTAQQLGVADSFAPDQNVRGGTAYLDSLLVRYHDNIALALAAYNAGPQAVDRYHGIPPYHETRLYVARVIHEFNRRVTARRLAPVSQALPPTAPLPNASANPALANNERIGRE